MTLEEHMERRNKEIDNMTLSQARDIIASRLSHSDMRIKFDKAVKMLLDCADKALEQESVLAKIRAEIEQGYCAINSDYDIGRNYGLYMATQIIDNHKQESEGKK